jgi:hypothetical protein
MARKMPVVMRPPVVDGSPGSLGRRIHSTSMGAPEVAHHQPGGCAHR